MPRFAAFAALAAAVLFSACGRREPDKAALLDEILLSRNDNDPRLDSAFNTLTPATRRLFREKYRALPPESRNQRGTIVHLLGKNLDAPEDWAFLREVVGEPPCLSLTDCAKPPAGGEGGPGDAVTLAYPALVALKQAERVLAEGGPGRDEALSVALAGKASPVAKVSQAAARLGAPALPGHCDNARMHKPAPDEVRDLITSSLLGGGELKTVDDKAVGSRLSLCLFAANFEIVRARDEEPTADQRRAFVAASPSILFMRRALLSGRDDAFDSAQMNCYLYLLGQIASDRRSCQASLDPNADPEELNNDAMISTARALAPLKAQIPPMPKGWRPAPETGAVDEVRR